MTCGGLCVRARAWSRRSQDVPVRWQLADGVLQAERHLDGEQPLAAPCAVVADVPSAEHLGIPVLHAPVLCGAAVGSQSSRRPCWLAVDLASGGAWWGAVHGGARCTVGRPRRSPAPAGIDPGVQPAVALCATRDQQHDVPAGQRAE